MADFFGETYQPLIECLAKIDPYFSSLTELRQAIAVVFQHHFAEKSR
nr:DUF5752 family protein [Methylomarinum sp. Ch1-1]MDP4519710.1 DUF5752 family protein [Methylomarinum sp. Ch1-1]